MDFKQLFDDDRAVSPVIGVILMVAITVILAAVIGTFVLGLGDQVQQTTPQASFSFDTNSTAGGGYYNVTITHESGDSISASNVEVAGELGGGDSSPESWANVSANTGSNDEISAGSTAKVDAAADSTLRVVYNNPDSDSSSTLGRFEVPSE